MKYLVSVIIPVYNCKKYLSRAVESVIKQNNFSSCELILVDDGSTDGSAEICDNYKLKYGNVKVIHQANAGVSAARNSGINSAEGEWIFFLDSDDYLLEDAFIKMLKFSEADFVVAKHSCNAVVEEVFSSYFDEGIYVKSAADEKFLKVLSSTKVFYPCWSKLYRLSIIKANDVKFPIGVKIAEDMVFVYTYLKYVEKIAFINEEVYFYFVNDDNTTNVIPKSFDIFLYIFEWQKAYFNEIVCNNKQILSIISSVFIYRAFDSIKIATDAMNFFGALKYVSHILNNDTFYNLYSKAPYTVFNCKTDELISKYILKKNSFMICVVMFINKLKSKFLTK